MIKASISDLSYVQIVDNLEDDFDIDWGVKAMNTPVAWDKTRGDGVKIAVIDTGIDINHTDLKSNIVDVINMCNQTRDVSDDNGHGSAIAGLVAGKRTGVAPSAELYIAKVLNNKGYGSAGDVVRGINFAIESDVDVLCMSLGVPFELPLSIKKRISKAYQKGITIVSASGNSGVNKVEYPATYDEVISVGGVREDLTRVEFSNYGKDLDVVAPATKILSTHRSGNYVRLSGTSISSALVTGSIALIISYYRNQGIKLSPNEVKDLLKKLSKRHRHDYGYGFMDLSKIIV